MLILELSRATKYKELAEGMETVTTTRATPEPNCWRILIVK